MGEMTKACCRKKKGAEGVKNKKGLSPLFVSGDKVTFDFIHATGSD